MRFTIICFASLLLIPALGASPPPHTSRPRPVEHGEIVKYQSGTGPRLGVVLGTKPRQGGIPGNNNIKLAPFTSHSPSPPGKIIAYNDQVVTTQPGHVVRTGYHAPLMALNIDSHHETNPPRFKYFSMGPVKGSPSHQDRSKKTGKS